MRAAGYPDAYAVVGNCWAPGSPYIGKDAAAAKLYLQSKLAGAAKARGAVSTTNMKPVFACRLAEFIKAAQTAGHNIELFSGWRPVEAQQRAVAVSRPGYACTGGSSCPHPQGRAADLLMNGVQVKTLQQCASNPACRWAHANAARAKLVFPLNGNPLEPWHVEPIERSAVSGGGGCDGSGAPFTPINPGPSLLPPDDNVPHYQNPFQNPLQNGMMPPPPPPLQQSPYSQQPFSSALPTQTPVTQPPPSSTIPTTPTNPTTLQTCTARFTCESGLMFANTTSCTKQLHQICQWGCAGDSCATAPSATSTSTIGPIVAVATGTNAFGEEVFFIVQSSTTPTGAASTSVLSLLEAYAGGLATGLVPTTTVTLQTVVLNPELHRAILGETGPINVAMISTGRPATATSSGTSVVLLSPVAAEQTFSAVPAATTSAPIDKTFVAIMLGFFKTILLWALEILRLRS